METTGKKGRFTKPDLAAVIISKQLLTKASVMAYAQDHGTVAIQAFVQNQQKCLLEFIREAREWEAAREVAAQESTTSWEMLLAAAHGTCEFGDECHYARAVKEMCQRNSGTFSLRDLAVALRKVIQHGPSKTARVPLILGPTNCGKSTFVLPFDALYGAAVFHKPALGSKFALRNLTQSKRFLFWDDYCPVEYGQSTVPVATFLSCFDGAAFEVQCSQSFNDGNIDFTFKGGAVLTAKEEGLWLPSGSVTQEDVRHMQSRVHCFRLAAAPRKIREVTPCATHLAKWISENAAASDAAVALQVLPLRGGEVGELEDWSSFAASARLSTEDAAGILAELHGLGAVTVKELREEDWLSLQSVQALRPLVKRRVLGLARECGRLSEGAGIFIRRYLLIGRPDAS